MGSSRPPSPLSQQPEGSQAAAGPACQAASPLPWPLLGGCLLSFAPLARQGEEKGIIKPKRPGNFFLEREEEGGRFQSMDWLGDPSFLTQPPSLSHLGMVRLLGPQRGLPAARWPHSHSGGLYRGAETLGLSDGSSPYLAKRVFADESSERLWE